MFWAFKYIIIVRCQTHFDLLFNIIVNYSVLCATCFMLSLIDLVNVYEDLICLISTQLNSPGKTWKNEHKWSWKVIKNHFHCSVCTRFIMLIGFCLMANIVLIRLQMENKAKRKRIMKSDKQDDNCLSDELSSRAKVRKTVVKGKIEAKISVKVSMTAEVGTTSKRKRGCKQSVMRRKRAGSTPDSGSVHRQADSELVHDMLPPRKRSEAVTSVQNAKPSPQGKRTCQSVSKKLPTAKKQHATRPKKGASGVEKKKAEEEQLETAVVTGRKKSGKVEVKSEFELPPASSPVIDKTKSVKTEKSNNNACTSSKQLSCRKFIGAHVSICGLLF